MYTLLGVYTLGVSMSVLPILDLSDHSHSGSTLWGLHSGALHFGGRDNLGPPITDLGGPLTWESTLWGGPHSGGLHCRV